MTAQPETVRPPLSRWLVIVAVATLALAAWLALRSYTGPGARECLALYRSARTAADTARIDTTFTAASLKESDPRSCGFMRTSARWR